MNGIEWNWISIKRQQKCGYQKINGKIPCDRASHFFVAHIELQRKLCYYWSLLMMRLHCIRYLIVNSHLKITDTYPHWIGTKYLFELKLARISFSPVWRVVSTSDFCSSFFFRFGGAIPGIALVNYSVKQYFYTRNELQSMSCIAVMKVSHTIFNKQFSCLRKCLCAEGEHYYHWVSFFFSVFNIFFYSSFLSSIIIDYFEYAAQVENS